MALESAFQRKTLIPELERRFPDCVILKNDPGYIQGIPDLTVLYKNRWALLEVKKSAKASHQPNQDDYVDRLDHMGFSRFVYPENLDEVMDDLESYFRQGSH